MWGRSRSRWLPVPVHDGDRAREFDRAWEILFVYGGAHAALEYMKFGPNPQFEIRLVSEFLLRKQEDAEQLTQNTSGLPDQRERCVCCLLPFGVRDYPDPVFGEITVQRNPKNRFYCTICDIFLRMCPGKVSLQLPVLALDVKDSRGVRSMISNAEYALYLAQFHREAAGLIQRHRGFVVSSVGDCVIGVWPSGWITPRMRLRLGWDPHDPGKTAAMLAIEAAEAIAKEAPSELDPIRRRLPYRGALDTTEMVLFAATTEDPETEEQVRSDPERQSHIGPAPRGLEDYFATSGTVATDMVGDAVEVATALAGDAGFPAGGIRITERSDSLARINAGFRYESVGTPGPPVRVVRS